MMNAKLDTLDKIIEMMDEHMLKGAKKKGAAIEDASDHKDEAEPDADDAATITATTIEAPKDELDPEMLRKLLALYSQEGGKDAAESVK